jgi:hypothetical protein
VKTVRIRIEGSAERGYLVQLRTGDDGEPVVDDPSEEIPADLDVAAAPAVLGGADLQTAVREFVHDTPESAEFPAIGAHLGSLLLRGSVGQEWDSLRLQNGDGLRTLLEIEDDDLQAIPWEIVYRGGVRLFIDSKLAFARVHKLRPDDTQELVPLRLLVVEGPQDEAEDTLGAGAEIRGIKSTLPAFKGRVDAEFIRNPTREELIKALQRVRPHVFHFIGHGLLEGKEPALKVGGWSLTRQFVLESLRPMPRVAVLNACRTGDDAGPDPLSVEGVHKLTDAFLAGGAAAAIGMQGDVRGSAARLFGTGFYDALAKNLPVDEAVTAARKNMVDFTDNAQARDWCLPSLTLAVVPEHVLPLEYGRGISEAEQEYIENNLFGLIGCFVDRMPIRWELAQVADPDDQRPARVVRIIGETDSGKTWLVHWIRTRCALRGRRVMYVDFTETDNLDFVEALKTVCETSEDISSLATGTNEAFERFLFDLGFLVNGTIPPDEMAGDPPPISDRLRLGGDNEKLIFRSFRTALEAAAGDDQLILIFDHVDGIRDDEFRTRIFDHVIAPLSRGEPPNVRLIVVLSTEQQSKYWPSEAETVGRKVEVKLFDLEEYAAVAEEFIVALGKYDDSRSEGLITQLTDWAHPPVKPVELLTIRDIVRGRSSS